MKNRHPEQLTGQEPKEVRNERENAWKISVTLKKQLVTTHGNDIQSAVMCYL